MSDETGDCPESDNAAKPDILTAEERKAVAAAVRIVESREAMEEFTADNAATLRGLLERLGGEQ